MFLKCSSLGHTQPEGVLCILL